MPSPISSLPRPVLAPAPVAAAPASPTAAASETVLSRAPRPQAGTSSAPTRRTARLPAPASRHPAAPAPAPTVPSGPLLDLLHEKDILTKTWGWHGNFDARFGMLVGNPFGHFAADLQRCLESAAESSGLRMGAVAEELRKTLLNGPVDPSLSPQMRGMAALLLYGAREMHRAMGPLADALQQHPSLCLLPVDSAWRLWVDQHAVVDEVHSALRNENEAGRGAGMCQGYTQMARWDTAGVPLSADMVVQLHGLCVDGVWLQLAMSRWLSDYNRGALLRVTDGLTRPGGPDPLLRDALGPWLLMRKGLRNQDDQSGTYRTLGFNATEKGLAELRAQGEEWIRVTKEVLPGRRGAAPVTWIGLHAQPKTAGQLKQRIQDCLDQYRASCAGMRFRPYVKLRAVAACCQALAQLRPFPDGNARTIGVVMNKLLSEQCLRPTALEDVSRLAGLSQNEVMQEIWDGQERFKEITRRRTPPNRSLNEHP